MYRPPGDSRRDLRSWENVHKYDNSVLNFGWLNGVETTIEK